MADRHWNGNLITSTRRSPSSQASNGLFNLTSQHIFKASGKWPADDSGGIAQSGLIVHLDAYDANSYPGSGSTITDLTSTGANATLLNGAIWRNLSNQKYFDFDGTNDYARIPATSWSVGSLFNGSNDFTISLWVNVDSFPTSTNYIYSPVLFSPAQGQAFITLGDAIPTNQIGLRMLLNNSWQTPVNTRTLMNHYWYNICVTFSSSSGSTLYCNGLAIETSSTTGTIGSSSNSYSYFGASPVTNQYRYLDGSIASLLVYDRAITAAEAAQNFNNTASRFQIYGYSGYVTGGLIYNFDAGNVNSYIGSGSTWENLSGSTDISIANNTFNKYGGSFTINSTSQNTMSGTSLTGGSFSIEVWFNRTGNSHDNVEGHLFTQDSGNYNGNGWQLKVTNSDSIVRFVYWTTSTRSSAVTIASNSAITNSNWYQVVVTYDGSYIKMYQNKTEVHSSTPSASLYGSTANIGIGMFNQAVTNLDARFNGQIGIIRAYDNVALSAAQVATNYDSAKTRYGLS